MGQYDIVEVLLKQNNNQEIIVSKDKQGENGFMKACKKGDHRIIELLLKHPSMSEDVVEALLNHPNNDEMLYVSFQVSCKLGHVGIVKLLLKEDNYQEIISSKDNKGNTGYMNACLAPSISVMKLIHDHTTDPIERKDAYGIFKSLCNFFALF